jgi:tetratricopeptide (TPR) repeat protein
MRSIHTFALLALSSTILYAADSPYEIEFQRAIKLYPPGDYNSVPVMHFSPITTIVKQYKPPTFDLLAPVETSDTDIKILFTEAARYFATGRWDLAEKRYKQTLLLDPNNNDAKAHLYDILILRSLWSDESRRSEFGKKHSEISKTISKDILPAKEQE